MKSVNKLLILIPALLASFSLTSCGGNKFEEITYEQFLELAINAEIHSYQKAETSLACDIVISDKDGNVTTETHDKDKISYTMSYNGQWVTEYTGNLSELCHYLLIFRAFSIEDNGFNTFYKDKDGNLKSIVNSKSGYNDDITEIKATYVFDKYAQITSLDYEMSVKSSGFLSVMDIDYEASFS